MTQDRALRERIINLSMDQRVELERWLLREAEGAGPRKLAIPPRPPGTRWPLSFSQQRLWVLNELEPGLVAYNIPRALHLRGDLDVPALRQALDALVDRHESLRTAFIKDGGEPFQVVQAARPVTLPLIDLTESEPSGRSAEVHRLLLEEARRPFDLERDLMVRGCLLRLGPAEHILALTMHHIASDGWSVGIVERELAALYDAFSAGMSPALAPLPIQYADYAVWHRQWFEASAAEQLTYWRDRLAGAPPTLDLPVDHRRSAGMSAHGGREIFVLPPTLTKDVEGLGRTLRATPFMVYLAVFKALLARHSGLDDIIVGTAIAGRTRMETEGLIGFFVNMLVMRTDLAGDPTVRELVARVRETALGAYGHQDMPFERLVQELKPERMLERSPLFQVALVLQEKRRVLTLRGLEVTVLETSSEDAPFDLNLSLTPGVDGLTVRATYRSSLFEAATVQRMLTHYAALLRAAVDDPSRRISALPLTPADEFERHLGAIATWNDTARPYPRESGLWSLFDAHARQRPDAIAVVSADQRVTYGELADRAGRVAGWLRRHGVSRGDFVGICLDRSVEMIVAILGTVRAGAAYVPVDPVNPDERRDFMLADAGVKAIVVGRGARHKAGALTPVLVLDASGSAVASERSPARDVETTGDDLAYLMYTSGSTGRPKGVAVPQRAVARLVANADYVQLGPDDVVGHASNVAFDAATFEIWGPLLNGARLVILAKEVVLTPAELKRALQVHEVTVLFLTTSLFNQTVRESPDAFRGVRHVLFGGEAADPRSVEQLLASERPERLLHVYGPTETTTFATWYPVDDVSPTATTVPIGRPIANTLVRVLDGDLRPPPVGIPGEIFIGGPGLAWGYHGRADVTAERFIPDPWSETPGARLYRTGDIGRYRVDGAVEFLGRADGQVKIRGHRIEFGEVEHALRQAISEIRDIAVVAREVSSGDRRLVAYMVATGERRPTDRAVRMTLRTVLPDYMIPSAFVWTDALPLMLSGKVDRAALSALPLRAAAPAGGGDDYVAPETPLEVTLARIWEEVLGVERIGATDDFFERGGHSLLAVRMLAVVEETCGRRIPLAVLFERPTVQRLGWMLVRLSGDLYRTPFTRLREGPLPPLFFLHGDYNGGFYSIQLSRALGPEQTFYALHPHGLDGQRVPRTIEAMAEEHLRTVRELQPTGPYYLGGHCNGGLIAFEMARRLRAQGETVAFLAILDARAVATRLGVVRSLVRHRAATVVWAAARWKRVVRHAWQGGASEWRAFARRQLERGRARMRRDGRGRAESPAARQSTEDPNHVYGHAVRTYLARRYDGKATVFRPAKRRSGPADLGWGAVCGDVEVHEVPGTHLSFITDHVATLAEHISSCLRRARPN